MNDKMDKAAEAASKKYQEAKEKYEEDYHNDIKEMSDNISSKIKELQNITNEVQKAKEQEKIIIDILKKQEEKKNVRDFHKILIPKDDLEEIEQLREVASHLRNEEPLDKVIWKTYYEKPFNDLVGRVLGDISVGIYRIINLNNLKSYIGQSRDLKGRWRTHVKRGLGAESGSRNKLYMAMKDDGVENFAFELVEECSIADLNEREKFWIDFFKTQSFGYNSTSGGS